MSEPRLGFRTRRGSPGVAAVELDYRHIGWVRQFGPNDWRGKLLGVDQYPDSGHRTRDDAGHAVVARLERIRS